MRGCHDHDVERAGLGSLSPDEASRFTAMNRAYASRFGFPFIIAVRDNTKASILRGFQSRLSNDTELEFIFACTQVERIAELRLKDQLP